MADNYLEKKMEEHRHGQSTRPATRRLSPTRLRPGTVGLKINELRVYVTDGSPETGAAIVRRLRDAGCKVAFSSADDKSGRELAQSSGARFYPKSFRTSVPDDLSRLWGGVDVTVFNDGNVSDLPSDGSVIIVGKPHCNIMTSNIRINSIASAGLTPNQVAYLCLVLCLAESECLNGVTLGQL